ncbi:MAG: hypothetical protein NZO58_08130 [Gemmataceae bacterium]|nr:hypothetical protein [Gemmataceae bacterium]
MQAVDTVVAAALDRAVVPTNAHIARGVVGRPARSALAGANSNFLRRTTWDDLGRTASEGTRG